MDTLAKVPNPEACSRKERGKRPMPRAERRVQLLTIAYQIIDREGVGALTMSTLAERSGAAKPIVYEHFANSQEVIVCILDSYFQRMSKFVLDANAHAGTIEEFFDISIDAMFEFHQNEQFNVKRITNGFSVHARTNDLFFEYNLGSVEFYRILLDQQGVDPDTAAIAASMLHELILGSVNDFASKANADSAKHVLKMAVSGIIKAIAGPIGQKPVAPARVLKLDS